MNRSAAHVINEVVAIGKFLDKLSADQKKKVVNKQVELMTQKIKSLKLQPHVGTDLLAAIKNLPIEQSMQDELQAVVIEGLNGEDGRTSNSRRRENQNWEPFWMKIPAAEWKRWLKAGSISRQGLGVFP